VYIPDGQHTGVWQGKVPQEQERESATETLKKQDFQNWKTFDKEFKASNGHP